MAALNPPVSSSRARPEWLGFLLNWIPSFAALTAFIILFVGIPNVIINMALTSLLGVKLVPNLTGGDLQPLFPHPLGWIAASVAALVLYYILIGIEVCRQRVIIAGVYVLTIMTWGMCSVPVVTGGIQMFSYAILYLPLMLLVPIFIPSLFLAFGISVFDTIRALSRSGQNQKPQDTKPAA